MKSIVLGSVLLVSGCSHLVPHGTAVPELPFASSLVEEMQKKSLNRAPASLAISDIEMKSPRRVYFSALYHQYLTLSHHIGEASQVEFCPQFHHDKVETDESRVPEVTLYKTFNSGRGAKEYFPEIVFTNKFSINDHQKKMLEEIKLLCEDGVSDNYYKFDNLITHYAEKESFHSRPDSMKSILKIPVFANYYLLQMLKPVQAVSSVHPEEKKVIAMTQTHWFEHYVTEAYRVRHSLIKNKMVRR